jgi:hypothetical protein
VVIALGMDAMRGIDYRSESVVMTLIIAESFANQREAMQGYYRVGRFGDKCWRVSFKDTTLINADALRRYKQQAMKFLMDMKKPVTMKAVKVKEIKMPTLKVTKTSTY